MRLEWVDDSCAKVYINTEPYAIGRVMSRGPYGWVGINDDYQLVTEGHATPEDAASALVGGRV